MILGKILKFSMESSGHFAATAKLWDTGMRLIFRPIGDTMGLVLRPFALMMIKWAVPFYQKFAETIPDIMEHSEQIAEGVSTGDPAQAYAGTQGIRSDLFKTLFGVTMDEWQASITKPFTDLFPNLDKDSTGFRDWLGNFVKNFMTIPEVYGDTGEAISTTNEEMNSFVEWMKSIADEVKKRTTLEGLGIEPGSDFTSSGQGNAHSNQRKHFGTSKLLSRNVYDGLVRRSGQEAADAFLEARGYDGIASGQSGNVGGKNTSGSDRYGGITINIQKATMEDPNLGAKIQTAVQKEMKKLPGHR